MEREPTDSALIRTLTTNDLNRLVRIDRDITGTQRRAFYESRLHRAISQTAVQISLGAEIDGMLVGAVMGTLQYGEFGLAEPVAVLDTILVDPEHGGHGIGTALFDQLDQNLRGLHVERVRTELDWSEQELMGFLAKRGYAPVPRLVLERPLEA
jgi:predicted N-acetyltransferase YhbS